MARFFFRRGRQGPVDEPASPHAFAPDPDAETHHELVGRLRRLEWPSAPRDVRERVLERVLDHAHVNGSARAADG